MTVLSRRRLSIGRIYYYYRRVTAHFLSMLCVPTQLGYLLLDKMSSHVSGHFGRNETTLSGNRPRSFGTRHIIAMMNLEESGKAIIGYCSINNGYCRSQAENLGILTSNCLRFRL